MGNMNEVPDSSKSPIGQSYRRREDRLVLAMTDPRPAHLGSLISINREIAAGLLGRA